MSMPEINDKIPLEEIQKWQKKLDGVLEGLTPTSEKTEHYFKNIKAYREDSNHFLEKGDYMRAFEAVIWAWAWYEIGQNEGLFD